MTATARKLNLAAGPYFQDELSRLARRIERINALNRGDAYVSKVVVDGGWVKRHYRAEHKRIVIKMRRVARAATRGRRSKKR